MDSDELDRLPIRPRATHGVPRSATSKALKAKWMADNPTKGESAFRHLLMTLNIEHEFGTQVRIAGFIVDFYHAGIKMDGTTCSAFVVEIDGASHFSEAARKKDRERTAALLRAGVKRVLRFTNKEVVANRSSVAREIMLQRTK